MPQPVHAAYHVGLVCKQARGRVRDVAGAVRRFEPTAPISERNEKTGVTAVIPELVAAQRELAA